MEEDILEGFSIGADDYIKKPFSILELRARVEAVSYTHLDVYKRQISYRCGCRKQKRDCKNKEIKRDYLEEFVLTELEKHVLNDEAIPVLSKALNAVSYTHLTKKFTKIKDYTPDKNGRIYRYTKDGPRIISNFIINPKSEIIKTDGCDSESKLILEGILEGGVKLPEVEISMEEFIKMDWITQRWGIRPTISPGRNMKD